MYQVTLTVTDNWGASDTDTLSVTVDNVKPTVNPFNCPVNPVPINTEIQVQTGFTDPGVLDTHTGAWDWGNGQTSPGTVTEQDGSGTVTGKYTYSTPGVYIVSVTVTDKDNGFDFASCQFAVIYDPNGNFVTGGGWIQSPEGAYVANPDLEGKAAFGFVSKYQKGSTVPTGVTEFQFELADLNFHSTAYDWLIVAGARAQYKGIGTINGEGAYKFILTAIDGQVTGGGGVDKFRIKIWYEENGVEIVVYDNQPLADINANPMTVLSGGSIVIHNKK